MCAGAHIGRIRMNDKQRKLERYRELNRDAKKGQIVCAGSSLMEMFPVEKFAAEEGEPVIVYNRGIGGFVTSELLDALDICILDLEPSRLFINIGTNDLSDAQIPISRMMRNYEEILERTRQALPEIEIYLMAYYPVNYEAAAEEMKPCLRIRTNEKINAANQEVQKLAERCGYRYIDIGDALRDERGRLKAEYTIEGMHIKEEGYREIFPEFMKYAAEPGWRSGSDKIP